MLFLLLPSNYLQIMIEYLYIYFYYNTYGGYMNNNYKKIPVRFLKRVKKITTTNDLLIEKQQHEIQKWINRIEELEQNKFIKVTKKSTQELMELRDYCNQKLKEVSNQEVMQFVSHFKQRLTVALENLNVYAYQTFEGTFDGSMHQAFKSVPTDKKKDHYKIAKSLKDGYYTYFENENRKDKKILQYEVVEVFVYNNGGSQK